MKAFKAYDIRGKYPQEVDENFAYKLGRAFAKRFALQKVVVGNDIRHSGPSLKKALIAGFNSRHCQVYDIGMCGTELIYFTVAQKKLDGGVMITASHNPREYNGMKLVEKESRPISAATGLKEIEALMLEDEAEYHGEAGMATNLAVMDEYVRHILSYIDVTAIKPYKIVLNVGNGAAGSVLKTLLPKLPCQFVTVYPEPDGDFPHGVPNPLLPENRAATKEAVLREKADLGIAWDGDFDRCFIFDERGEMIEGYYMVGFLAAAFLEKERGAKIIIDPRLIWNSLEIIQEKGGVPLLCRSGHAFIKEMMRKEKAIYGGEMSAHHYFQRFSFCDSGMITWLLILELLSKSGKKMSELLEERLQKYPISGEINVQVENAEAVFAYVEAHYRDGKISHLDGLSVEYPQWRFNLRASNTEPVIRLNVETRGDTKLLELKKQELLGLLK